MPKKQWGDPVITLRIPAWQISGLKMLAKRTGTSVSALIREQIDSVLWINGIKGPEPEQLPGQISVKDLPDA